MNEENTLLRKEVQQLKEIISHLLDKINLQQQQLAAYAANANEVQILPGYVVTKNDGTENGFYLVPTQKDGTKHGFDPIPTQKDGTKRDSDDTPTERNGTKQEFDPIPTERNGTKHEFDPMPADRNGTKHVFDPIPTQKNETKNLFYHIPAQKDGTEHSPDNRQGKQDTAKTGLHSYVPAGIPEKQDDKADHNGTEKIKQAADNTLNTHQPAATSRSQYTGDATIMNNESRNRFVDKLFVKMKYATADCISNTANILLALYRKPATSLKSLRACTTLSEKGMVKRMAAMKKAGFITRISPPKQYLITAYAKRLIEESITNG